MFRIAIAALLTVSAAGFTAGTASATILTYTLSGTGSGSIGGNAFTNTSFAFTLVGDTAAYSQLSASSFVIDPLNSASFVIGSTSGNFSIPTRLGTFNNGNGVFFSRSSSIGGSDLFDFTTSSTIDISTVFGSVTATSIFALNQFTNVSTTAGLLSLDTATNVVFSNGPTGGTVPEPASWAMMIGGFGLVGAAMRRRRVALTA